LKACRKARSPRRCDHRPRDSPRGLGAITASIDGAPLDLSAGPPWITPSRRNDHRPVHADARRAHADGRGRDALGGARALDAALTVARCRGRHNRGADDGAFLEEGAVEIAITPERSQQPIDRVTIAVDGQPVEEFAAPPYAATLDLMPFGPARTA